MKNKNILKWIVPVLCVVGLSSCLKNKNEQPDFSTATPVVELPVDAPRGDGSPNYLDAAFAQADAPSDYFFYVNYAANEANDRDIKVTLQVDPTIITRYNNNDSDASNNLTIVPSAAFTMPLTVTIPAGQRKVQIPVKFVSTLLNPDIRYGLPVTITDASGVTISKNFTSLVVRVAVKNRYDGIYSYTGSLFRGGANDGLDGPVISGVTTTLITDGATANSFDMHWANGGGVGGIDNTGLRVDPLTNKVTVYSKANAALQNTPGFDNRYDPATRTFYLSFQWSATRAATLTFKYIGPR
jgi:hypothetical protein